RLPGAGVVGGFLVAFDALKRSLALPLVELIHADEWYALGFPIFEPDRIDDDQARHVLRVHQGISESQHAPHRMPQHDWPLDANADEEGVCVGGLLMQAELIGWRLAGFAEADLIGNDDAKTLIAERPNVGLPGGGAEILAMQQDNGPTVWLLRPHIHECHRQQLPLGLEVVVVNRLRVVEVGEQGIGGCRAQGRRERKKKKPQHGSNTSHAQTPRVLAPPPRPARGSAGGLPSLVDTTKGDRDLTASAGARKTIGPARRKGIWQGRRAKDLYLPQRQRRPGSPVPGGRGW